MTDRRVPPHDKEAERAIIGACLIDNKKMIEAISVVSPDDFYVTKHREIFEAMITMNLEGKEVNSGTLYERLIGHVTASEIGKLMEGVPEKLNIKPMCEVVRHMAALRKILREITPIASAAYDKDYDGAVDLLNRISINQLTGRREKRLSDDIKSAVEVTNGDFSVTSIFNMLQGVTQKDRPNIRQVLHRLKDQGIIEPSGRKDGVYRRIITELEEMDWQNAPTDGLVFDWPLELHDIATVFPKDVCVVAGFKDSGKTGFAIDFIRRNMDKWDIHYFNCEMSNSRLRDRLRQVDELPPGGWTFKAYSRGDNFADAIKPDAINVVDYLEITEEHYLVAKWLKQIRLKLDKGMALVLLQKPKGRDTGMGGDKSLQTPTLYVALEHGKAKLVSVKTFKGEHSPRGHIADYKLIHGWKFHLTTPWHSEEAEEALNQSQGKFRKFGNKF